MYLRNLTRENREDKVREMIGGIVEEGRRIIAIVEIGIETEIEIAIGIEIEIDEDIKEEIIEIEITKEEAEEEVRM